MHRESFAQTSEEMSLGAFRSPYPSSGRPGTSWPRSASWSVTKDLGLARDAAGQQIEYETNDAEPHDLDTERPYVTFLDATGAQVRLDADVVVGCDGSFGPSRAAVPDAAKQTWERTYPFAWLAILADVAPSTDELIYAWHPNGFAMHSMRSASVSRLYLQVPPETDIAEWSEDRIWDALATRLGYGENGWDLTPGPIRQKRAADA